MLRTDPVTLDPKSRHIRVFRRVPPDRTSDDEGRTYEFDAEAYHWGSLTTGHVLTALWILLGPFAFANVAGWMNNRPNRLTHTAIRLVGVGMTALLVVQAGYLVVVLAPRLAPENWRPAAYAVAAAVFPFLFAWGLVMRLSTQSHFTKFGPGERIRLVFSPRPRHLLPRMFWNDPQTARVAGQWDDPAGATVGDETTWGQHAIVHRLRRIHLGAGCGVVVAVYASLSRISWLRPAALALAVVVVLIVIGTSWAPRSKAVITATAILPLVSLTLVAASWTAFVVESPSIGAGRGIHGATFVIALALGAIAVAAASAGLAPLGAIVVGTLFGASLGVGVSLMAEKAVGLDVITEVGAGWVTVAMFHLILFFLGTAAVLALRGPSLPEEGRALALVHRVTTGARPLLVAIGLFGIAAGVVAFVLGCIDVCTPEMLRTPRRGSLVYQGSVAASATSADTTAMAAARIRGWMGLATAVILGGLVALFALQRLPRIVNPRFVVEFDDLVDLSKALVVLLPTYLVGRSMLGSIRRGTSNRQVGILWDIASMWPRWFHPLAPPAYGPMVVSDLAHRLVIEPPDLLEGHSQGSVLCALAVSQMEEEPEGLSLITYGSPIGMLYRPLFPSAGIDDLIAFVDARLGGRWVNLWRETDPIGGRPIGLGDRDLRVRDGVGHSDYEVSTTFSNVRQTLV